jgi:hypothetical protein
VGGGERISCHTGVMEKTRQPGVIQLVREYLARLVEERRRRLARARLRKAFETGLVEVGDRKWSRDELYNR